jgi:hypothetical protein
MRPRCLSASVEFAKQGTKALARQASQAFAFLLFAPKALHRRQKP